MSDKESSLLVNDEEIERRIIKELPKTGYCWNNFELYHWEGFGSTLTIIKAAMVFKETFKTYPNDVLLASYHKTGSTWLKAICLSIMQGNKKEEDLLVKDNPHFHVPTIEAMDYYLKTPAHDIHTMSSPRLFHTHLPYIVLPDSIKNSNDCKIIYITRNPKDTLISMWHFFNKSNKNVENGSSSPLEEVVDYFCNGVHQYGPFILHVLEYWEESNKRPQKILFLKYEDLKMDPKKEVAKIALFIGKPFDNEEDLKSVLNKCSLERLKNLEVNKSGSLFSYSHNSSYFRKGIVGDWKNYMTPQMEEQVDKITRLKLQGSGLEL